MARKSGKTLARAKSPPAAVKGTPARSAKPVQPTQFPVAAVGASAGGMEAFIDLLKGVPPQSAVAMIFAQHLHPRHPSALVEILSRETKIPIVEAANGIRLKPGRVYVVPHNSSVELNGRALALKPRVRVLGPQTMIDLLMRSLAEQVGNRAIGVVLSGNASDGTLGLRSIKAAGGLTFAQDPGTAKFDGMPRSAILSGCADFTMPPREIGREFGRLGAHPLIAADTDRGDADPLTASADGLAQTLALVRKATGVDFTHYKSTTVKRRILRRMILHRVEEISDYVTLLKANPAAVSALYDDLLINVTQFFRDPESFEALKKTVYPKIVGENTGLGPIRIWVPGCSTGEEPYSLAISLLEYLEERRNNTPIQIFATDISERALERARAATYPETIMQDVSPERLRRFFTKCDAGYQISKRVREMCVLARQNLAKDPPFSKLDVISCRNLLIYLGPELQKRVMPVLHYALKPDGYLLLGSSETIGSNPELFSLVDKKYKIYRRKPAPQRPNLDFTLVEAGLKEGPGPRLPTESSGDPDLQKEAERAVLARYSPPGVIVDENLNILQFRGKTSTFLEPASGTASLNLLRMAREGLVAELRNAVHRSRRDGVAVRREGVRLPHEGGERRIDLEVIPLRLPVSKETRFLILFTENLRGFAPDSAGPAAVRAKPQRKSAAQSEKESSAMRHDLEATREYLQSIIEELEAANEELRSANEEVQSSNEEMQSTNEELKTAKEELQSTNEELNTVNEELQNRNLQLSQMGNDLLNLLSNVSIPIVMLGNDLRIRRFTPISERILNLIPSDVGRPISDLKFDIEIPDLTGMLREVIENLGPKVMDVKDVKGRRYSLRIRPYRTEDHKIEGVVMVLIDLESVKFGVDDGQSDGRDAGARAMLDSDRGIQEVRVRMQLYTRSLIAAQEEERRRISRELHDDLNQRLALLSVEIERMEARTRELPPPLKEHLSYVKDSVNDLSQNVRRIAHALHPTVLDELGLVAAIQGHLAEVGRVEKIQVKFRHRNVPAKLPPTIALSSFRIVQEAVRNAVKHSGGGNVNVMIHGLGSSLHLSIRDNGKGFKPGAAKGDGMGLIGMEERIRLVGGTFRLKSKAKFGTSIDVQVPTKEIAKG